MIRSIAILLASLALLAPAAAQRSYPMVMSVEPPAAQVGTTSEHVVKSRYTMEDAYEVLISGDGVAGEVVLPQVKEGEKKPSPLQTLTLRVTVDPNAMPGVRDLRVATPTGVSTVGQLVIVQDPVIVESKDNNAMAGATACQLPATLCGTIERAADVDYFKFHARSGETLFFHVRCMRLQDRIHDLQTHADPILSIRNAAGSTVTCPFDPLRAHAARPSHRGCHCPITGAKMPNLDLIAVL